MGPLVAALGTGSTMFALLHEVGVAKTPLKVTVLAPWVAPKFRPLMVTEVPVVPETGEIEVMLGATVKVNELLATPLIVTTTGPVVAPEGIGTTIASFAQPIGLPVT